MTHQSMQICAWSGLLSTLCIAAPALANTSSPFDPPEEELGSMLLTAAAALIPDALSVQAGHLLFRLKFRP